MQTDLTFNTLEQALWAPGNPTDVTHHSDQSCQYLSVRYANRLAKAGLNASMGSVGDSYDNALTETVNGLYKTWGVHKDGSWRNLDEV